MSEQSKITKPIGVQQNLLNEKLWEAELESFFKTGNLCALTGAW